MWVQKALLAVLSVFAILPFYFIWHIMHQPPPSQNPVVIYSRLSVTTPYEFILNKCTITAYSPRAMETDDTPNQTAIMEAPVIGRTCAVSQDLVFWLGRKIYVRGYGIFLVNDLMNARYTKRIDLCMAYKDAKHFNPDDNVTVVLIGDGGVG